MAPERFDAYVREQLNNLPVPGDTGWDRLSEALDNRNPSEAFDKMIASKLRDVPVVSSVNQWAALEAVLQLQASRSAAIVKSKLLELIVLLLVIWLPGQWASVSESPIEQVATTLLKNTEEAKTDNLVDFGVNNLKKANRTTSAITPSQSAGSEQSSSKGTDAAEIPRLTMRPPVLSERHTGSGFALVEIISEHRAAAVERIEQFHPEIEYGAATPFLPETTSRGGAQVFCLGIYSSFEYNFIHSPFDADLLSQPFRRYRAGYGGGLQVAFLKRSWEIATGLGYSVKSYEPRRIEEVLGNPAGESYTDALREIELSMMTVPVHFKYRLIDRGRWSAYILGGGALHLVMTSGYDRTQPIADNRFLPPSFAPESRPVPDQFPEASVISQKTYDEGLFEGGNLEDNSILTLNAGVGMEYLASARMGIFAEPFYQQLLFGKRLGPTRDRISTFSIQLGLRVHIP